MANTVSTGTVIARNLVDDPRLTHEFATAVQAAQTLVEGGGVDLTLADGQSEGYVVPWAGETLPAGDVVCVLILDPADGLAPAGGSSLTPAGGPALTWLRGSAAGYQHALVVRTSAPKLVRLHAPAGGRTLRVLKSGVFDLSSWQNMQARNLIYFDGGGLVYGNEDSYTLPPATTATLGGVIVGDGLSITPQGVLSAVAKELEPATADKLGGMMVGRGLQATANGLVSVKLGDGLEYDSTGAVTAPDITPPDLSDYYTKSEIAGLYYNRTESDGRYLTSDNAESKFYTKTEADAKFATKSGSGGGSGSTVDAYTKSEADARFQSKLSNASGGASNTFGWFVRNGVCSVHIAVRFTGWSQSVGVLDSSYAPERELVCALVGNSCSGYAQIKTDGTITAIRTNGSLPTGEEYARGGISWGVDA